MAIDSAFLEQLKSKNDIVEVVSKYCSLEQKGGNFWANCPLPGHNERTASFSVNQYGQFFHCFGCGKGGDVITFVMEMEAFGYIEAVKYLAERAGLQMPDSMLGEKKTDEFYQKKTRLLALLKDTAKFYVHNLKKPAAAKHIQYIEKRKLEHAVVPFGLGASLDFQSLPKYLSNLGYTYAEMIEVGVVSKRRKDNADMGSEKKGIENIANETIQNGTIKDGTIKDEIIQNDETNINPNDCFDALGGRLIFPIINNMNEVIAFGGRLLEKSDFAKYKNTNNNVIFTKNKTLYNINKIKKQRSLGAISDLIMVEGYMDVISIYEAGFENVVASMGTSLTKEQARLLKRYTENVYISYDGDFAGQAANIRGLEILKNEGLNVKVVSLPEGLDPDDVIKKMGNDAYRKCLDEALPLIDYKLDILSKKFDITKPESRRKYIANALKVVKESESVAEQEELLKQLSAKTNITYESLKRDLENETTDVVPQKKKIAVPVVSALMQAERYVLAKTLSGKQVLPQDFNISLVSFSDECHIAIAAYIMEKQTKKEEIFPSMLFDLVEEDSKDEVERVLLLMDGEEGETQERATQYFADCLKTIERAKLEREIDAIKNEANETTDKTERMQLIEILMNKTNKLKNL